MGIFSYLIHIAFMILGVEETVRFPPALSREEEARLFELKGQGDERAREKLIEHNLRLVAHVVRKYYLTSKNTDDLISVGSIGLVKAIDSFNDSNGTRFATYAAKCIQNEILMHFRSQKKLCAEVSINETIDIDRDGNPLTYTDILCSDENVGEEVGRKVESERLISFVENLLTPRERQIMIMRYGLYGVTPATQREIADSLKISRSYVSRIEKSALEKLAQAFDGKQ